MRARVLVVNTEQVPEAERPHSLQELTDPRWKGKVVMARPQFGTSATQAACLFQVLGVEKAQAYYRGLKENDVQIAPGNKQVAEWVGAGRTPQGQPVSVGVTDTDDTLEEIKDGRPVTMIFPDRDRPANDPMGTLFIPNTLAILRDCPHPEEAKKLVDFLLSPEVERRLAEGGSHQIPLHHPDLKVSLPSPMAPWNTSKRMKVDFAKAAELWEQVQEFLRGEYARP
jgi:iron(III) transport system substrate-binding protein